MCTGTKPSATETEPSATSTEEAFEGFLISLEGVEVLGNTCFSNIEDQREDQQRL